LVELELSEVLELLMISMWLGLIVTEGVS